METGAQFQGYAAYRMAKPVWGASTDDYGYVGKVDEKPTSSRGMRTHLTRGASVEVKTPSTTYDMNPAPLVGAHPRLFSAQHTPGYISFIEASPGHSAQLATTLGIAALDHKRRYGALPEADSSLSRHSVPIVRRMVERGVVAAPKGNPGVEVSNEEEHDPFRQSFHLRSLGDGAEAPEWKDGHAFDDRQVAEGRGLIRGILKQPKKPTGAQFEQGRLF